MTAAIGFVFALAIFLFAMQQLEAGIRSAGGQGIKTWFVNKTNSPASSAACGILATAILQSSSMVSLLVLAFVSAGAMPLYNGIGVVLGANLGTTMTGWMATIIGFKMNLQALVIPLLGAGAICRLDYFNSRAVKGIGKAVFAFGLLIYGLDIMKQSVGGLSEIYDLQSLSDMPAWVFLLSGTFLAALMQSSSAVMIITLSLLSSSVLSLESSAAVIIGADLGTTSTTILGSVGKSVVKKQLAFAHVFFNVVVNSAAFLVLLPLLPWLIVELAISDKMFALVTFHSAFNLFGILLFLPILKLYTRWVERLIPLSVDQRDEYFTVPIGVQDAALESLQNSLHHLSSDALYLSISELALQAEELESSQSLARFPRGSFKSEYQALKKFEGNILRYATQLQQEKLSDLQGAEVNRVMDVARSLVYATKTLKDLRLDLQYLNQVPSEKSSFSTPLAALHRKFLSALLRELIPMLVNPAANTTARREQRLQSLYELNTAHQHEANTLVSKFINTSSTAAKPISTWFNLNHELHHYARYMIDAVRQPVWISPTKASSA